MKEGYEEVRYARGKPMRGHYAYLEDGRGIDQCSVGTAAGASHTGPWHTAQRGGGPLQPTSEVLTRAVQTSTQTQVCIGMTFRGPFGYLSDDTNF